MLKFFLNMTKSEILLYKMIEQSSDFDYSISEMAHELNISRQTVCKSLKTLVTQKLVEKSDFFIGCIRRCKYKLNKNLTSQDVANDNLNKNLTSQDVAKYNTETLEDTSSNVVEDKKNTSSKTNQRTSKTIIIRPPNLNNNINKINNQSNQIKGTPFLNDCQEEKTKKIKKFFHDVLSSNKKPKKTYVDRRYNVWNQKHKFNLLSEHENFSICENVLKNLLKQENKDLINFLKSRPTYCVYVLLEGALERFNLYKDDIHSNATGYFRTILINDIAGFDVAYPDIAKKLKNNPEYANDAMREIKIKKWDLYEKYYPNDVFGKSDNDKPLTREVFDSIELDKPCQEEQQVCSSHAIKKSSKKWLNFFKSETRRLANAFSMT